MKLLRPKKSPPRLLTVKTAEFLTPNMRRITFAGPELEGIPQDRDGGNCKIMLPEPDETREAFSKRLIDGPPPVRRTFTVRATREDPVEMDIDFVAHGTEGPASRWALEAEPGFTHAVNVISLVHAFWGEFGKAAEMAREAIAAAPLVFRWVLGR